MGGVEALRDFAVGLVMTVPVAVVFGRLMAWVDRQSKAAEVVVSCVWSALALGLMIWLVVALIP